MTHVTRRTLLEIWMLADLVVCGGSLLLASAILYRPLWGEDALILHHPLRQLLSTALLGLAWHYSLVFSGAYRSYRMARFRDQLAALALGTTCAAFWAGCWLLVSRWGLLTRGRSFLYELVAFWATTFFLFLISRIVGRFILSNFRQHGRNLRNVLIVGTNRRAVALAQNLEHRSFGCRLVGFIDDHWHFTDAPARYKEKLLGGGSAGILQQLRTHAIDEVILALPLASSYQFSQQIVEWCREQGILVRYEGNLFSAQEESIGGGAPVHKLQDVTETAHSSWSLLVKRLLDLLVASFAILIASPVLLGIAVAIRFTSPGPIFFNQERLGRGKRRFRIHKFRTMVIDAEKLMAQVEHLNQSKGPTFKLDRDPRITPIGSFLRKTSLDELPQLFNVWLGDMSLVGPRPLPLRDYRGFSEDWHRRRFSVKPGITCLWQVNGRSTVGFDRWMELDIDYIDRWSLWLDVKILVQTIPAVMRGSGAM